MNPKHQRILRIVAWACWVTLIGSPQAFAESVTDSAADLAAAAKEILRANCFECHSSEDARADVRVLDHTALIESEHVVPKRPDDSYLYQLITSTDDDVMPPISRPALTAEQIGTIRKWITAGAAKFPADADPKAAATPSATTSATTSVTPGESAAQTPSEDVASDSSSRKSEDDEAATDRIQSERTQPERTRRDVLTAILGYVRASKLSERPFLRFFSIRHLLDGGVTSQRLAEHRVALAKAINHLSRERELVIPTPVDAAQTVFAVDIRKLGWHRRELRDVDGGESTLDLFDLVLLEYPYAILPADAPEFDSVNTEFLDLAKQVRPIPFVRVDWFCSVALQPPLYHDLLQLPQTLEELEQDLGVDVASNLESGIAKRAGMAVSGVSRNNRAVERHPHRDGYYWKSHDFQSNLGRENILTDPIDFRASGGEMIFRLPNGTQGYYVSDGRGNRLDEAPTSIVVDKFASDRVVRNGLGCIRCHRLGIKDFSDSVRDVLEVLPSQPGFDKRKALELYLPRADWDQVIDADQKLFAAAMEKLGQMGARREPLATVTADYLEGTLSVVEAAAELGVDAEQLKINCRAPGFTRLGLSPLASGGVIRRDAWEDNFDAAAALLGVGTPLVAVDSNTRLDFVPEPVLDKIRLVTNKENNFFEPGDELRITVDNQSGRGIEFELYGTSVEGKLVRLTEGVQQLAAGESFRFPESPDEFIEIRGGIGRERITLFASTAKLPAGKIYRGKNVADRVVHDFFGPDRPGTRDNIVKKSIVIETR